MLTSTSTIQKQLQYTDASPDARFDRLDYILTEQLGSRPLARRTNGALSASHINRVLNGKGKTLVLETLKSIARAAQLPLEDVIFYVERQREYARKIAA